MAASEMQRVAVRAAAARVGDVTVAETVRERSAAVEAGLMAVLQVTPARRNEIMCC